MLEAAKAGVRVKSSVFDIEINGLIAAGIADMRRIGIAVPDGTSDPLLVQAVVFYVQAHFGYMDEKNRAQYLTAYEDLRNSLSLAVSYQNGNSNQAD